MTDRLLKHQAEILAAFIHSIRRDWEQPGIVKALGDARLMGDSMDLAIAAVAAARDPKNRTPAVIAMQGPHWAHVAVAHKSSGNTTAPRDKTCAVCYMPENQCRARWSQDHRFESVAEARARAIARAENAPARLPVRSFRGKPIEDVELP